MTYHRDCNKSNTTGATSGAGTAYHSSLSPVKEFVLLNIQFSVECFVHYCFSVSPFSIVHCIVWSSIYGF
jgi:hypothetical protein